MTIQQLVAERLTTLGLSYRAAAEKADGYLSYSTLHSIVTGRHTGTHLNDETVYGLHLALGLPESTIRGALGTTGPAPVPASLQRKWDRLTPKGRQAVTAMIDALLDVG